MYGIMKLQGGGPPGSGSAQHKDYVAGPSAYKTGSRKGTAAGNKGDKKSQKTTARELDQMIKSGDAARGLDRLVTRGHQDQGYKSGISSPSTVIGGMTKKQQDFINRNRRKDGSLNSAAQSVLDFYSDNRSDYQRDLDKFIKSSPEARDAYLDRFPIGGALNLGIPAAFNALAPAPIKMLGKVAKAAKGIPELLKNTGMVKDLSFEVNRAKKSLEPAKEALIDLATKKGILNTTDAKNMEINQRLKTPLSNELKNIGLHSETPMDESPAVVGPKYLKDLEGEITENELANHILENISQKKEDLVYDPEEDVRSSGPYEIEDWMKTVAPAIDMFTGPKEEKRLQAIEDYRNRNERMPHVPISHEQKATYIKELTGVDVSPSNVNNFYDMIRSIEERGNEWNPATASFEEKPTAGTIDLTTKEDIFNIGGDQSIDPQEVITQQNISTDLLTPINEIEPTGTYADGTPIYGNIPGSFNAGSFPAMNIFGTEVKGPRNMALDAINKYGNSLSASEKEAFDILNSLGQADGGYLKQYDDGGYANMSTFEKLKAIADSHYG
jgi:hypothetical protein